MKIKSIVLAFLCMLMLVGCTDNSSSEKDDSSKVTTTTTYKNFSFNATVLVVLSDGTITTIDADFEDSAQRVGEAWLEYDDSVKVPSDIKVGDKIKITVWGNRVSMKELSPPIIYDIKSIEKIS